MRITTFELIDFAKAARTFAQQNENPVNYVLQMIILVDWKGVEIEKKKFPFLP